MGASITIDRPSTTAAASAAATTVLSRAAWAVKADTYSAVTDALTDLSGGGSNARLGASVGSDAADLIRLAADTTNGRYIYLPGTASNYLSVPDSAALSITGDQSHEVIWTLDSWSTIATIMSKSNPASNQRAWRLDFRSDGKLALSVFPDGSTTTQVTTSVTVASVLGTLTSSSVVKFLWTWRASDGRVQISAALGASGIYQQIGTDLTANIGAIADTTATVNISGYANGATQPAAGKFYRARSWSDITQTTLVLDINATDSSLVEPYSTFTEASSNAATVTINRGTSGVKTTVVDRDMVLAGASLYAAAPNASTLNFAAASSFTLVHAFRFQTAPASSQALIAKKADLTTGIGYALYLDSSGQVNGIISDGTNTTTVTSAALTSGVAAVAALIRDVANDRITLWVNGTSSSPVTDTTTGTLLNTAELRIARLSGAGTSYFDGPIFASALYTSALSTTDLATLQTELLAGAASTVVPILGTYTRSTATVYQSALAGETQPRLLTVANGDRYVSDGSYSPVRLEHFERHIGGTSDQMAGLTCIGIEAGLGATKYRGVFIGLHAGRSVAINPSNGTGGGQSCTLVGDRAGEFTQSNETTAFGVNALALVTTGNFNHAFGAHVLESLVSGHRNTGVGDEAASYLVSGSDGVAVGFYAASIYNGGTNGSTTHSPTTANRFVAIGNYTGYNGDAATSEANDWIAVGYRAHIGQGANYAIAIGSQVLAGAAGAVAIGVDHAGTAATTSTQDDFILGTALHAVKVPGSLAVTGNTTVTGNLAVTGIGARTFARATSDTTKTSTAVLANHSELLAAVVASATYRFEALVYYSGNTTGDIQIAFTIPSGTILWFGVGPQSAVSAGTSATVNFTPVAASGTSATFGAPSAAAMTAVRISGLIVLGVTGGNLQLQWAQGTSDGTASTLYTNSTLTTERVA